MNIKKYKKISVIFLISFALQLIFIFALHMPLEADAKVYDSTAVNLLSGKGFSADGVSPAGGYVKYGYVLFLAGIYKIFGHSIFAVEIIQAILTALSCVLIYRLCAEILTEPIGYCSALIMAFHPAFLITSSNVITESLFTFLLILSIFYLARALKKKSLALYAVAGIFLAISAQVRFTTIFFPFFILGGFLLFYKDKFYAFKAGVIIFSIVLAMSVPWVIRDYICFGQINPFVAYGGSLWLGTYTKGQANQTNSQLRKARVQIDEQFKKVYSGKDTDSGNFNMGVSKVLLSSAIENIKEDPLGYAALFPIKVCRLWVGSYSGFFDIGIPFSSFLHDRSLIIAHPFVLLWKLIVYLYSLAVFLLALIGMVFGLKIWKKLLPVYLIVLYFNLLHMIVFANLRVGIPALPYMIMFAAMAIFLIFKKPGQTIDDFNSSPDA